MNSALRFIIPKVLQAVLVLWLAYTAVFAFVQALPSDQLSNLFTPESGFTDSQIQAIRDYYGLEDSAFTQYWHQLWAVLHGDLGFSISTGQPVLDRLTQALPGTVELAVLALLFAVALSLLVTWGAAAGPTPAFRRVCTVLPEFLGAVPVFFIGLLVLRFLSFQLGILSVYPDGSLLSHLVPPLVLSLPIAASISQVMIQTTRADFRQPFVHTALAKGLTPTAVLFRHVMRGATGPTLTVVGMLFGAMLSGAVIIETVFSRRGLGVVLTESVVSQDVALIQGLVLFIAFVVVVINLTVELLYPVLDPRIRRLGSAVAARVSASPGTSTEAGVAV